MNLKNARLPALGRTSVSNDVTRDSGSGGKGEESGAKDAKHCNKEGCQERVENELDVK